MKDSKLISPALCSLSNPEGNYDLILIGGGLANCLLAWRLLKTKPAIRFVVLEKGQSLGGKHTWSYHQDDVSALASLWLAPLLSASWPYYDVAFPKYRRRIESRYSSIRSRKFHEILSRELSENVIYGAEVQSIKGGEIELRDGRRYTGQTIFDGRGFSSLEEKRSGFQKFVGLELRLTEPHGLKGPVLMDATVTQEDGFRFFYCLPWSEDRLLVEDTRYSHTEDLDKEKIRAEILLYVQKKGWQVAEIFDEEVGSLPLPLSPSFLKGNLSPVNQSFCHESMPIGTRAGLFHRTTGYSLPHAVRTVEFILSQELNSEFSAKYFSFLSEQASKQVFYSWLNRLLFVAAKPIHRYRLLEHFYRLPVDLIGRFYASKMTLIDKIRFFVGKPPVGVGSALISASRQEVSF